MKNRLLTCLLMLLFASQDLWAGWPVASQNSRFSEAGPEHQHQPEPLGSESAMMHQTMHQAASGSAETTPNHAAMHHGESDEAQAGHDRLHSCCDMNCPGCMASCVAISGGYSAVLLTSLFPSRPESAVSQPLTRIPENLLRPPIPA